MIYTENTRKALNIAYQAHLKQKDKSDIPYIFHPYHLAEQMDDEASVVVALLHDVVEDSDITFEQLEKEFSNKIIDALKILTHDKSIDYITYINLIKSNPLAKKVKLADLKHNMDTTRLISISDKDIKRIQKYKKALKILSE